MKKKPFSYFITPFGVISFSPKYVFINGKKTTSVIRLIKLLEKFNESLFCNSNMLIFHAYDYKDLHGILHRYLIYGRDSWHITKVSEAHVYKASEIFHGQYCVIPSKCDLSF